MFCAQCGKPIFDQPKFCNYCGAHIEAPTHNGGTIDALFWEKAPAAASAPLPAPPNLLQRVKGLFRPSAR